MKKFSTLLLASVFVFSAGLSYAATSAYTPEWQKKIEQKRQERIKKEDAAMAKIRKQQEERKAKQEAYQKQQQAKKEAFQKKREQRREAIKNLKESFK